MKMYKAKRKSTFFTTNMLLFRTAMTVLAVAFYVTPIKSAEIEFKCTNQDEFVYATPKTHCSSYYKCYQKQRIKFECASGTIFDFYKQKCTRSAGVCYEPVCTGRSDGMYQDTTHACRRAFYCRGGNLVGIDNCPHGFLHNGQSCQQQDLVSCDLPEITAVAYPYAGDKRCTSLLDGNHGIQDNECRKYIICKNQEVTEETLCPHGLRFDSSSKRCASSHDVQCSATTTFGNNDVCHYLADGQHLDQTTADCRNYVRCQNGKLISKHSCGNQAVFNGKSCVPNPLYECPLSYQQYDICQKKSDGFQSNPYNGCAHYVKCSAGRTVQNLECPKNNYFDPEKRQCVFERHEENRKCRASLNRADCGHLESGQYYQDKSTKSACRDYYFCYNGNRTDFKCSYGKIFNGEICVEERAYTCPNIDPNSCDGKQDGYYKDKSGGCRSYYFCSSGKKFSYLCAEGQFFDGNKCVERKSGQSCGSNECVNRSDGYYYDLKSNCRNYYYCLRGEKATSLTCRGSKLFNGSSCVNTEQFACPSELGSSSSLSTTSCVQRKCYRNECKKDGFYPDIDSGCKDYYFCISGKKTTLSCSDNFVFNGEICVPSDMFQCLKYCANSSKC